MTNYNTPYYDWQGKHAKKHNSKFPFIDHIEKYLYRKRWYLATVYYHTWKLVYKIKGLIHSYDN